MNNASLELGGTNWAEKDGNLLGYAVGDTSGRYVPREFDFSRGSNLAATRVDAAGLIEKGRENVLLRSNSFNSAPWSTSSSDATIGQSGYDGTNDAWLLSKTAINGRAQQNISTSGVQTFSVYAKAGTKNWTNLFINGGPSVFFDLQNGVLGSASNYIDANIESVGNGFYRCSVTFNATISRVRIYVSDDNNNNTGTSGNILIQNAQLEQGLVATSYIPTTTTSAQAGILENTPRLDYSGGATVPSLLLEPSRTNLIKYSEDFSSLSVVANAVVTSNAIISPSGLLDADEITFDGTLYGRVEASVPVTIGQPYTISLYLKNKDLSDVTQVWVGFSQGGQGQFVTITDEWQRYDVTSIANGTNEYPRIQFSSTGSLYAWGFQVELGSYPTSYIPNNSGGTITRAADDAVATHTIPNTETLTFFTEFVAPERQSGGGEYLLNNSSGSSRIRIYQNTSDSLRIRTDLPAVNFNYSYSSLGISIGDKVKVCLRIENGVMTVFINGVDKNTFGAATINFAKLRLRPQTIMNVDSTIIFPTALTDAECITLTTI